jgi:hypothetical protein
MKKTQDKRPKPAEDPKATKHKGVPTIPKEIWEEALERTRRKEAKDAGPAVLWPAND